MPNLPPVIGQEQHPANDQSPLSFIIRISKILECLSQGYNTVSDIAEYCGFTSSTAHRLLNTLRGPGLIICDQINHRYYMGPMLVKLITVPQTTHQYLSLCTLKEMRRLSAIAGENISLDIMIGFQSMNLSLVLCKQGLQVLEDELVVTPVLPLGSTWKVLLAQLESQELKKALTIASAILSTPEYTPDQEKWLEELNNIDFEGYFVSRGEKLTETIGISAPIRNYVYPVVLTIVGPESRLEHRITELVAEIKYSSNLLSQQVAGLLQDP
jgi:IclR family transcriptional regulator, KDG regulon repressor